MKQDLRQKMLGVLGGMGPLASTEFLKTIYEYNLPTKREQESPRVILYSDPTFPDRTEVLLKGDYELLLARLIEALSYLGESKAEKIVICCITIHHLLPKLPDELRKRIISLIDVIFTKVLATQKQHLLICTKGTRQLEIFPKHKLWQQTQDYLLLPDEKDQKIIHQMIYELKVDGELEKCVSVLEGLKSKYSVNNFIAGCTEIHLLSKYFESLPAYKNEQVFLDPLIVIAQEINNYLC